MKYNRIIGALWVFIVGINLFGQDQISLKVHVNQPGSPIQETMWGLFFEDINFGADGGIYAEMIKNRSFEFYKPLMAWKEVKTDGETGSVLIVHQMKENPSNPRFVRITSQSDSGWYGISNEGFRGMGVKEGLTYCFSFRARLNRRQNVKVKLELIGENGNVIGEGSLGGFTNEWQSYKTSFICYKGDSKAHFNMMVQGDGVLDVDMVSLFPSDTWKNRENGLRGDLVQLLDDMHPGFLRFPGGCIVEGHELATRYQWKKTVGNIENREVSINRWNTEFPKRSAPDYFQSFGLGFYEYFVLCEDLGAEPLPILNCGMACQYNTAEVVPIDEIGPYVEDMIDLIEFANGSTDSEWGKLRSSMGHPEPFHLKYLGIGNEQWGPQYIERYQVISEAIRLQYPDIKLVAAAGPRPDDDRFHFLWKEFKTLKVDLVDEHFYMDANWFFNNASRYDSYDRKGPKVFAGEYACHTKDDKDPESRNTWLSALAEAAFMTGLERNAEVVHMASYAPLLGNVDAWQWRPDMIWFNNLKAVPTPNYYVQKLYSLNKGTHVVPVLREGDPVAGKDSLYASSVIDIKKGEVIVKMVNASSKITPVSVVFEGLKKRNNDVVIDQLSASKLNAYNSLSDPNVIVPKSLTRKVVKNQLRIDLNPHSFYVIKLKSKELN